MFASFTTRTTTLLIMWRLSCLIVFLSSLSIAHLERADDHSWDVLMFTQSWPPTRCKLWMDKKPHTCNMPKEQDSWTIHGMWPTKLGTMGPYFCNKTWLFDPEQVRPIEDELEQSWVNIEAGTPLYSFWAHEWNKHGTCAASIEPLNSQIKYFTEGLFLLKNYTMNNVLEQKGIIPSDSKEYNFSVFYSAIKNALDVEPEIECRVEKGKQYLIELRICFNKSLKLTNCFHSKGLTKSNCDLNRGIVYPESVKPPNRLLIHLYNLVNWIQWLTL